MATDGWLNDNINDIITACNPAELDSEGHASSAPAAAAGSGGEISREDLTIVSEQHASIIALILCQRAHKWKPTNANIAYDLSAALFQSLAFLESTEIVHVTRALAHLGTQYDGVALLLGSHRSQQMRTQWRSLLDSILRFKSGSSLEAVIPVLDLLLSVAGPQWLPCLAAADLQALWAAVSKLPLQADTLDIWSTLLHVTAQQLHPSHCMAAVTAPAFLAFASPGAPCRPAPPNKGTVAAAGGSHAGEEMQPIGDILLRVATSAADLLQPQQTGVHALLARLGTHLTMALQTLAPAELASAGDGPLATTLPASVVLSIVESGLRVPQAAALGAGTRAAVCAQHSAQLLRAALQAATMRGKAQALGDMVVQQHEGVLEALVLALSCDSPPALRSPCGAALLGLMGSSPQLAEHMARTHPIPLMHAAHASLSQVFPAVLESFLKPGESAALQFHASLATLHTALCALQMWANNGQLLQLPLTITPESLTSLWCTIAHYEIDGGLPYGRVRPMRSYGATPGSKLWEWGVDAWASPLAAIQLALGDDGAPPDDLPAPKVDLEAWDAHLAAWRSEVQYPTVATDDTCADNVAGQDTLDKIMAVLSGEVEQRQAHTLQPLPQPEDYKEQLVDDTQDELDLQGCSPCDD